MLLLILLDTTISLTPFRLLRLFFLLTRKKMNKIRHAVNLLGGTLQNICKNTHIQKINTGNTKHLIFSP